ncbi:NAD/NADP octopine/nopaline dehydrogenase family protein [Mycoplana dimorpha]|uniref:2-dehydropantoate 2-reductase n=1 Tax=Mycoplana dimorpha TaxID=28320 RepID=A0A2T5AXP8_MYCDI|nr:NAD/NADP octopine/nopaline dehydrogenase family protein [Mycoplana dimorpha]PTM91503.1 ketopantoate reductase [Mycoplana dimorpha]
MRVGIVGAGSIAFGTAAFLEQQGHKAILWSPSGERTKALAAGEALTAQGAIEGTFHPNVAPNAEALVGDAEALVIALPAYGHKSVLDAIAPHVTPSQTVIFSSHASFGALYLSRLLASRGVTATIVAWGTTVVTGRQLDPTSVNVNTVRKRIDLATLPASRSDAGFAVCQALFGDRFVDRGSLMAIALSNLNPQNHMGIALGNMTRMERGETWSQGQNVTPKVGRLLEELDQERIAIATKLGLEVRNIFQHFHLSFHVPISSISQMNQEMHEAGNGGTGPATADSRYVTEDVPFGLVMTAKLGRLAGEPADLHEAGVKIFSAMYGRDFAAENDLLLALDLDAMSLSELNALCRDGYAPAK